MAQASIFEQILDPANRADPYPLYAELRRTPVTRQADGTYVVSTYDEIVALLHHPRVSSDPRNRLDPADAMPDPEEGAPGLPPSFIRHDPPEHDRLRELATRPFGPPCSPGRIEGLRAWLTELADGLIDDLEERSRIDIVDDFAYPMPVTAICHLLGVPREDESRFHRWADAIVDAIDPNTGTFEERQRRDRQARAELGEYLAGLADARSRQPGDDLISGMLTDAGPHGRMSRADLVSTAVLLLVAGHETTVNLIANGVLTLLRHPHVLERLRHEPDLVVPLVEELLRYEPPVQMLPNRAALADINIAGTTIPRGAPLTLVLAAADRDPDHFNDPDSFVPDRTDNQHLGFGGGIHYCFGAPLARVETQVALPTLARRLRNPRLVIDPPPYRPNPVLRGPRHLVIDVDGIVPTDEANRAGSRGPGPTSSPVSVTQLDQPRRDGI